MWVSGDSAACRPVTAGVQPGLSWPPSRSPFCQGLPSSLWARPKSASLQRGSLPPQDPDNEGCFKGGFWRNGATGKSSEAFLKWLTATQQEHAAVQRRLRISSHVPRSYCARFMTTEQSCLINILPFSSSWDVLHCFSVLFFSFSTSGAFLAFMWQTC